MPIPNWSEALNQFAILFDGRVPMNGTPGQFVWREKAVRRQ